MKYLTFDIESVPTACDWSPPAHWVGDDPFPPLHTHEIVCLGWAVHSKEQPFEQWGVLSRPMLSEKKILEIFSNKIRNMGNGILPCTLVTFNGRRFDIPVMTHRAFKWGVPMTWYFGSREANMRFSDDGHWDLADWLAFYGSAMSYTSLGQWSNLMGLPAKKEKEGQKVKLLWEAEKFEEISDYCLEDVARTVLLFQRARLLRGRDTLEIYQHQVKQILVHMEESNTPSFQKLAAEADRDILLLR